jgi:hypothetical protein
MSEDDQAMELLKVLPRNLQSYLGSRLSNQTKKDKNDKYILYVVVVIITLGRKMVYNATKYFIRELHISNLSTILKKKQFTSGKQATKIIIFVWFIYSHMHSF